MSEVYEVMKKYGRMMASQGYPIGQAKMMMETADGVFATKDGAQMDCLKESDIEKLSIGKLPIPKAEMKAVVYSQTPYCQRALREAKPFKACLDDMAQVFGHTAYVVDGRSGNASMGKSIGKALKDNVGCMILRGTDRQGNGAGYTLTMGRSLYEAVVAMTVLEKSAEISFLADKIGGGKPIAKWEAKLMRYVYKKKYSKAEEKVKIAETALSAADAARGPADDAFSAADARDTAHVESAPGTADAAFGAADDAFSAAHVESAPGTADAALGAAAAEAAGVCGPEAGEADCGVSAPGQTSTAAEACRTTEKREQGIRELLVEYGKKLVESGLVQGTWGNISVRLDEKNMLTTPSGLDYMRLKAADMVKVDIASLDYEGTVKPTSEKGLHAAIYKNRPDIGAVIHTHSKYCSVFAAAGKDMPVTGEYRKDFGEVVNLAAYALPGTKALMKNTAAAVGENFGAIMSNHGMVACGTDIEAAFNNCVKLEENGKVYLMKR